MATYQMVKAPSTVATHRPTTPTRSETHPDFRRVLTIIGLIAITTALVAGYFLVRDRDAKPDAPRAAAAKASEPGENLPKVTVVLPKRGGMVRTTNQPGSIRAFEFAPLYAKVSGYVRTLKVDRGTRVQKGQLLMEIYDPELDAAVAQAVAGLEHARAQAILADARVRSAEAMVKVAVANQLEAKATLESSKSQEEYREKQLKRIRELVKSGSIEQRLADEEEDHHLASLAAMHSAEAGIATADAKWIEAQAKLDEAKANVTAAKADVSVGEADLQKARAFLSYTRLESPYDGVVIYRGESVHPGSFIQSAAQGGATADPLLTIARVDVMRTIILVPDRDVPFCDVGDPVTITLDALGGKSFKGKVTRMAESEDIRDRTMRIEVDLPNPDGTLRDGMYGQAVIVLEQGTKDLTVPSTCLMEQSGTGEGTVLVVRDAKVHRLKVEAGRDDGTQVEILKGLSPDDQVILQPDASMAEGTPVHTEPIAKASATPNP
jgi:RND family efflux transporter MFP subunit